MTAETRALRFANKLRSTGEKVSRIIIEGDRFEIVLHGGESQTATPYEEWQRARKTQGR